jgi:hypothetical protein
MSQFGSEVKPRRCTVSATHSLGDVDDIASMKRFRGGWNRGHAPIYP